MGRGEATSERYRNLDIKNLERIAVDCVHAERCVEIYKIGEGNSNKVFRLVFDTAVLIARIPNPNAGLARVTTASEVATMEFARIFLSIPVPLVFQWSSDADNPFGAEYIPMEEAAGQPLAAVWDKMNIEEKAAITEDLVAIKRKLSSIRFSKSGSLCFVNNSIPGAQRLEVMRDVKDSWRKEIAARFCIDPVVESEFWKHERSTMQIDRGPWQFPEYYMTAIADREIAWISRYARTKQVSGLTGTTSVVQGSPEVHLDLLKRFTRVAAQLVPREETLSAPHVWHRDLWTEICLWTKIGSPASLTGRQPGQDHYS